jgi:hypothetical protein
MTTFATVHATMTTFATIHETMTTFTTIYATMTTLGIVNSKHNIIVGNVQTIGKPNI